MAVAVFRLRSTRDTVNKKREVKKSMKKSINQNLKLIEYKRLKPSYFGNPKYFCTFENEKGEIITAKTATNAGVGYCITNFFNKYQTFATHYTNAGNLIIDYDIR